MSVGVETLSVQPQDPSSRLAPISDSDVSFDISIEESSGPGRDGGNIHPALLRETDLPVCGPWFDIVFLFRGVGVWVLIKGKLAHWQEIFRIFLPTSHVFINNSTYSFVSVKKKETLGTQKLKVQKYS